MVITGRHKPPSQKGGNDMKYMIMISIFSPIRNETIITLYDGVKYETKKDAENIIDEIRHNEYIDYAYIREVE